MYRTKPKLTKRERNHLRKGPFRTGMAAPSKPTCAFLLFFCIIFSGYGYDTTEGIEQPPAEALAVDPAGRSTAVPLVHGAAQNSNPSTSLRESCFQPSDSNCTFYTDCLVNVLPCEGSPNEYALSYGLSYCNTFLSVQANMSPAGNAWANAVRRCLQAALSDRLSAGPPFASCGDLASFAFESHTACYTEGPGSVCTQDSELTFGDYLSILGAVKWCASCLFSWPHDAVSVQL